jgi:hypothetical protein
MEWGAEATVGYPTANEMEAKLAIPFYNLETISSGLISNIPLEKIWPLS